MVHGLLLQPIVCAPGMAPHSVLEQHCSCSKTEGCKRCASALTDQSIAKMSFSAELNASFGCILRQVECRGMHGILAVVQLACTGQVVESAAASGARRRLDEQSLINAPQKSSNRANEALDALDVCMLDICMALLDVYALAKPGNCLEIKLRGLVNALQRP